MGKVTGRHLTLGLFAGIAGAYAASAVVGRLSARRNRKSAASFKALSRAIYLGSGVTVVHESGATRSDLGEPSQL